MTSREPERAAGPIYIGGPDRCGKTLLAAILGSHSRIAIPIVGSNLWSYFHGQYGDLANDRNLDECLSALQHYKHARFLGLDVPRLRAEMRAGERTYSRLFALIHEHFAERAGKPRWGDQTGLVERYADEIFAAYPGVRLIHMVRDPRDRYEASIRAWPEGRGRAGAAVARWRYSVGLGERNARRYADRYRLLRYEDLVTDPESIIRGICGFVGEAFEPAMLGMPDAPGYRAKLEQDRGPGGALITSAHIGDFRGRIPPEDQRFIQHQLGDMMRRHGYAAEEAPMTRGRRLSWWLRAWPGQIARMAAWSLVESVQHRWSRYAGRRPAAAKVLQRK